MKSFGATTMKIKEGWWDNGGRKTIAVNLVGFFKCNAKM